MTITDGATRILVASIIRERKKLLYENQNLKKLVRDNFILDISDKSQCSGEEEIIGNQLHLLPVELDALNHAISPNLLDKMGWAMDERTGAVLNGPLPVFKAGFGTRVIALKCHLFALEAISAQFDMPLKFTHPRKSFLISHLCIHLVNHFRTFLSSFGRREWKRVRRCR
ncbi:MAG: hypothetical protein IPP59_04655 [Betaproteobacteria bacterium]|nr:hypothetical protein [Candidatus Dechloromonas phosphorivorans]